ncbi:helix-turn-helix domain-containing protein [Nostoc sp. CALU 1950]|uniref:helix-turn-helix domain-containing protein n=1 Tax=Nostoc sp. CALU 1950 TaxID=3104321 RepID=UPI003EB94ABB
MSGILNYIEENRKETKRLIGMEYEQLQQLIQNAEYLHHEKQALLESKKVRIITGGGGRKPKLSIPRTNNFNLSISEASDNFSIFGYPVWSQ